MSKILVLAAGGMLGHKVCQGLRGHQVIGVVRRRSAEYDAYTGLFDGVELRGGVDVLHDSRLEETIEDVGPDFVVNCVGLVKQLEEADDAYLAVALNSLLPHRLARICATVGARLIHISTDCVFDGTRGHYRESDPPDARDLYGQSKALGETTPRETAAVTLRTSFIGRELCPPWHGLLDWFLARQGGSVDGWAGAIYTGLTSLELADVIRRVVESRTELSGLYQVASAPISKYDLLELIREIYGLDVEVRRADEPAVDRSLEMGPFREAIGYEAPAWSEMIQRMRADPTPYDSWRSPEEYQP